MNYETAHRLFDYDPETGTLTWKERRSHNALKGCVAGTLHHSGYIQISHKRKLYLAHRVIWLMTTGKWPKNLMDHINGVRDDNRLCNLREATMSENHQNRKSASNTGIPGISRRKSGSYYVQLKLNGKHVFHTVFPSLDEAIEALKKAKKEHHIFHPELVLR